jgi:hypothetical protein
LTAANVVPTSATSASRGSATVINHASTAPVAMADAAMLVPMTTA